MLQTAHTAILILFLNFLWVIFQVEKRNLVLMFPTCLITLYVHHLATNAVELQAFLAYLWALFLLHAESTNMKFMNTVDLFQVLSARTKVVVVSNQTSRFGLIEIFRKICITILTNPKIAESIIIDATVAD